MHITIDVWVTQSDIEPNFSATGIRVTQDDSAVTLYLGHSAAEMEMSRDRIMLAIDRALEARRDLANRDADDT